MIPGYVLTDCLRLQAASVAADSQPDKLIATRLKNAKMKLREAQTPWANTPKSKVRDLQLALAVWQRLASAVRLPWFSGDRCDVPGYGPGCVRFIGACPSAGEGIIAGVELDEPRGAHEGDVAGKRYFSCGQGCGVMVPAATLQPALRAAPLRAAAVKASEIGS